MRAFAYQRMRDLDEALASAGPGTRFLAGGTNLVDLMKMHVEQPARLLDIGRLPLDAIEEIEGGGLRLGALVRNSDCAADARVRSRFPLLAQALAAGASPQLRNMATLGGNLLQRTRCAYFMDTGFRACNKRDPGTGCAAREGRHRNHAVIGASDHCIATHPSDMAVALAALEAGIEVRGPGGARTIAAQHLHRLPGAAPQRDTVLEPDELIVAIALGPGPFAQHSHYLKVRDRASFAFAVVSVAAALDIAEGTVRRARICLGGVAHKPWRAEEAEALLAGEPAHAAAFDRAANASIRAATPSPENAFKVELARRSVARALRIAAGLG